MTDERMDGETFEPVETTLFLDRETSRIFRVSYATDDYKGVRMNTVLEVSDPIDLNDASDMGDSDLDAVPMRSGGPAFEELEEIFHRVIRW